MWTSGAGGGYGGSYSGGVDSYSGGFGRYPEQGRHAGRGPKNWQRSDERIREEVNERLTDHPHIDATEIDVQVKNGDVTLTGTVESRNVKRMAEDVAEGVSGVKEVHNQLRAHGAGLQPSEMAHSAGSQAPGGTPSRR
jgi:osmotically-inducible protein OsmY